MEGSSTPREAFAYIAGYLDGEATIGFWTGYVEVKIDTCTPHALKFIVKHFGGKVVPQKRLSKAGRVIHRLQYKRSSAVKLLTHTVEFMHEKKRQAQAVLNMHELSLEIRADKKTSHKK
jgi:hypothetical protein